MPNQPRADNPAHAIRMEDELWARVLAAAAKDETTASAVVRAALEAYLPA